MRNAEPSRPSCGTTMCSFWSSSRSVPLCYCNTSRKLEVIIAVTQMITAVTLSLYVGEQGRNCCHRLPPVLRHAIIQPLESWYMWNFRNSDLKSEGELASKLLDTQSNKLSFPLRIIATLWSLPAYSFGITSIMAHLLLFLLSAVSWNSIQCA